MKQHWFGGFRRRRGKLLWSSAIAIIFALMQQSFADQIYLGTGDRITGTFVRFENNRLEFRSNYAGRMTIARKDIVALHTDTVVTVLFKNKSRVWGRIIVGPLGQMQIPEGVPGPYPNFTMDGVESIQVGADQVPPSIHWSGRFNLGITSETGNTEKDLFEFDVNITGRRKTGRITAEAEAKFEDTAVARITEKTRGSLGFDHFVTDKFFLFTTGWYEFDRFKDLNLRAIVGAGPGYQFYEGRDRNLAFWLGPAYLYEDEDFMRDDQKTHAPALIWNVRIDQFFFGRFVQAFYSQFGLWNLQNTSQQIFRTSTGLRFPLRSGFVATLRFHLQHETRSSVGRAKTDKTLRISLGYEW